MKKIQEIHLISSGNDIDAVLNEAAKFSESMQLSRKDTLRMRLLTEETMAMLRTLTGELELTLSFIGHEKYCIIQVETDTAMDVLKKDRILSVSATGENASAKGIMGKIRDAFETAFAMPADADWANYGLAAMMTGMPTDMYPGLMLDTVCWTLSDYRKSVEEDDSENAAANWDELEKSIVSNVADDVQVGVRKGHVVMSIIYKLTGKQ